MGVRHDCIIFDFFYSEYWHYRLVLSFCAKAEVRSFKGCVDIRLSDFLFRFTTIFPICFAESLEVDDFAGPQEFNRCTDIRIVLHKTQDIVIGGASLLLCCNHIRATFGNRFMELEIPVNFNRNVLCSRYTFSHRHIINQYFHDFTGKVFQVGVLINQFAAVIASRNFFFDFG